MVVDLYGLPEEDLVRQCQDGLSRGDAQVKNKWRSETNWLVPVDGRKTARLQLSVITSYSNVVVPPVLNCCCSKGSAPQWFNPPFFIFDIWALWHSFLSSRVPKCQKLKLVGQTSMANCKGLTGSAVKGLSLRSRTDPVTRLKLSMGHIRGPYSLYPRHVRASMLPIRD